MAEYIERETLYELLKDEDRCGYLDRIDIASVPAADVVPVRHARWNRPYISWLFLLKIKSPYCFCTNCVHPVKPKRKTNYCPNCGAKMDGGEQE